MNSGDDAYLDIPWPEQRQRLFAGSPKSMRDDFLIKEYVQTSFQERYDCGKQFAKFDESQNVMQGIERKFDEVISRIVRYGEYRRLLESPSGLCFDRKL